MIGVLNGHRALRVHGLAVGLGFGLGACTVGLPPYVDKSDSADTGDSDTPATTDTPDTPPDDTPVDPDAVGRAGAQGCAAPLSASVGLYATTGCLAPWSVSAAAPPASDGQLILQPGALRRIAP